MYKRHFTLVELLAAIGIVIILAGITLGGLSFASSKADYTKTQAIVEKFSAALEDFKADYGYYPVYPSSDPDNYTLDTSKTEWDLFYNDNSKTNKRGKAYHDGERGEIIDAYGNPLKYKYPNTVATRNTNKFALWSMGKDGVSGIKGEEGKEGDDYAGIKDSDDICSWTEN